MIIMNILLSKIFFENLESRALLAGGDQNFDSFPLYDEGSIHVIAQEFVSSDISSKLLESLNLPSSLMEDLKSIVSKEVSYLITRILNNPDAAILQTKNVYLGPTSYGKTKDFLDLVASALDAKIALEEFSKSQDFSTRLSIGMLVALDSTFVLSDIFALVGKSVISELFLGLGGIEQAFYSFSKGMPTQDTLATDAVHGIASVVKADIFMSFGMHALLTARGTKSEAPGYLNTVSWVASIAQLGSYFASDLGYELTLKDVMPEKILSVFT
jgi:hypothetical protein